MIVIHVDDGVLLDVHLVADDDGRVVGADLGTGQHTGVAADGHVAHDAGGGERRALWWMRTFTR